MTTYEKYLTSMVYGRANEMSIQDLADQAVAYRDAGEAAIS